VPRPFRTAAPYYLRYRPGYPPELIAQLARRAGLDRDSRVLDLGCGPGSLAIPLAAHAGEVVAVDAEPEMIAELSRAAPPNVTAVQAAAEDVGDRFGSFRLATAGRAMHWFDTGRVLDNLSRITPMVALCADDSKDSEAQSLVLSLAAELVERRPGRGPAPRYADILSASPFSDIEVLSVEVERTWTADELIGFAYSTSTASPERLGERRAEFEQRVHRQVRREYRERVPVDAVVGRRA
jgi:ubiquinone/menaquinone biosynthesis C-methylase UbiE